MLMSVKMSTIVEHEQNNLEASLAESELSLVPVLHSEDKYLNQVHNTLTS